MTDHNNQQPPSFKPPERDLQHYKNLRKEIMGRPPPAAPNVAPTAHGDENQKTSQRRSLFDITINADSEEGALMDEPQMLLYMAFKPLVPGLKLTPEQSQLIITHMSEILKEAEIEEQMMLEEEKTSDFTRIQK